MRCITKYGLVAVPYRRTNTAVTATQIPSGDNRGMRPTSIPAPAAMANAATVGRVTAATAATTTPRTTTLTWRAATRIEFRTVFPMMKSAAYGARNASGL